ncbi:unnamed protein product [Prorocentrum cordatum]|uniref:Endonuclease/exonuclease/phosphatase domain-containing protein n=1 Tax=Prorocentrum cordatum TaxID=2364126 RepID=A0ABN9SY34_9DINO|nr:unnamed protein product [Polarella glacialis]
MDRPVRLLSQNVWNSFFAGGPGRGERLRALVEFLRGHEVDVVVVQEMFAMGLGPLVDCVDADAAAEAMRGLGFVYQTRPLETLPQVGQSSGLAVYSKLPIRREAHGVFSASCTRSLAARGPSCVWPTVTHRRAVSCKGWLGAELELPAARGQAPRRLMVLSTHLEHAHDPRWREVRERQWRELAARASALSEEGWGGSSLGPLVVLVGDFNVCGSEAGERLDGGAEYAALREALGAAGLPEALVEQARGLPTLRPEAGPAGLRCSLDHAFVSASLAARGARAAVLDTRGDDGLPVSDHCGVVVELCL